MRGTNGLSGMNDRVAARRTGRWRMLPVCLLFLPLAAGLLTGGRAAGEPGATVGEVRAILEQHCFACHGATSPKAGLNLEKLSGEAATGEHFREWERVAMVLEQRTMPPARMPQPGESERTRVIGWIRQSLAEYARAHDGEPGEVTVRRLTSGEYNYAIRDLTGLDLDVGIDGSTDSVGGEGFTSYGDVQFMQDANLERYLAAARKVADHAVIGAGPLEFAIDPGTTGMEMAAIERIRDIYGRFGFRTVSGEGGRPFGLEKYGKAFFVAWQYRHRARLGLTTSTLESLAAREGITARFANHISGVINRTDLGYPLSEAAARWQRLPAPEEKPIAAVRTECEELQKFLVTWPSWLFARGDVAAGGAGDESPLEFTDRTLNVNRSSKFNYVRGATTQAGPTKIYLRVDPVNPATSGKPLMIWRKMTVAWMTRPSDATGLAAATRQLGKMARKPVREVITAEEARRLGFGQGPEGVKIGPDEFVSEGSARIEIPIPANSVFNLEFEGELGANQEHVVRVVITDRDDGKPRSVPTRAILGDMQTASYRAFRAGVMQYATLMPPNSHAEPTPADKDPIPDPFDNTYNVPEHDEFVQKVKYIRDDRFVVGNLLDNQTRRQLDNAWMNLYEAFDYHDSYLRLLASHYKVDLRNEGIAAMTAARRQQLPAEMRKYVEPLRLEYEKVQAVQAAARPRHLAECLAFAERAWRRPLTAAERSGLLSFHTRTLATDPDHRRAIRVLLARILVAPQFLYRVEPGTIVENTRPLNNWEMASRLSFFIWASIPDEELRRAAAAGELTTSEGIAGQVRRMLSDPKSRRLSTEFFGQWLGFYHFDRHNGVDTSRFTSFTNDVRSAMYDEAVSFFEHIIRSDRPVGEMLTADYTFLNRQLADFYGIKREITSKPGMERVDGAGAFHRGGLLRLGAVLTVTSAPLRTSPVKRGDWVLRRILGTPVPPPPADAGSLPADDKLFGGLSLKAKLEQHKRNPSCASCHTRIDPLGFALERYDSTGRWREEYSDGKAIEDSATLTDKTLVSGPDGLLRYLRGRDTQVRRTLSTRLTGYALGRTVRGADLALIDRMVNAGGDAPFSKLITEIATSRQFRYRSANRPPAAEKSSTAERRTNRPTNGVE